MSVRAWLRRHPEVWVLTVSALAWALLLAPASLKLPGVMEMSHASTPAPTQMGSMQMPGMAGAMSMPATMPMSPSMNMPGMSGSMNAMSMPGHQRAAGTTTDWTFPMMALMVLAMMLPATTGSVRQVAARSLWSRRRRATAEWIAGYAGVWLAASAVILSIRSAAITVGVFTPGSVALVIGLVVAAGWQLTPSKRAALNGCHRTRPLAPRGARADWDCCASGIMIGRECVVSCAPMMAAMTLGATASVPVMVGLAVVVMAERFRHRTPRRSSAVLVALLAVVAL
jgi:predicted metal-binding membrane protein